MNGNLLHSHLMFFCRPSYGKRWIIFLFVL